MDAPAGMDALAIEAPWNEACTEDSDCGAPTDLCAKQPGQDEGYCTFKCVNDQACVDISAPSGWTCNTVAFAGCEDLNSNWCGPTSELEDFPGIITSCP